MEEKIFTSLNLAEDLRDKLEQCAQKIDVDISLILSVLCYKAGKFICKKAQYFHAVDYQERGIMYKITPVYFIASDHEYIHGCRLSCKVSVSKLLSLAMFMFLDEIMENGINQQDLKHMKQTKNSYKKKTYNMNNFLLNITKNDQFDEYMMKIRLTKT